MHVDRIKGDNLTLYGTIICNEHCNLIMYISLDSDVGIWFDKLFEFFICQYDNNDENMELETRFSLIVFINSF